MPISVSPIPGLPDHVNDVRLRTAEFINREILPRESELFVSRRGTTVTDEMKAQAASAREEIRTKVKAAGLWAPHLPAEYGGMGLDFLAHAYMNEILAYALGAASLFGVVAPNSGNQKILLKYGTEEQKKKWLLPLVEGTMQSGFSMTEPNTAGSDPRLLSTRAVKDGDEWVINGRKWYTTNGSVADILVVMAVTNPDVHPYQGSSMIIVPVTTPGVTVLRDVASMDDPVVDYGKFGNHAEILYEEVRVPAANLIGREGDGFLLAQARLGPGRIHHCMRWLGQSKRAFDMMCERAVSRYTHGSLLAEKQTIQNWIADSKAEMHAARLMTLHAAWKMDQVGASAARDEIAMIKYYGATVLYNVIDRALQVHGSLGYSADMPLEAMYRAARAARIYDGPDEVHRQTVARRVLKDYTATTTPTEHIPSRERAAREKFAALLESFEG